MKKCFAAISTEIMQKLEKEKIFFRVYKNDPYPAPFNVSFYEDCEIGEYAAFLSPPALSLSTYNLFNMGFQSYTSSNLPNNMSIGSYSSLAYNINVRGFNHPMWRFTTSPITYDLNFSTCQDSRIKKISPANYNNKPMPKIENDVWIGRDVLLSPGITIGTGCIVAARSNVTKSIPPYAIVGGNPAKIIKFRFAEKQIEELLNSHWWEYDVTALEIKGDSSLLQFLESFYAYKDKNKLKKIVKRKLVDILIKNNIHYV